MSRIDQKTVQRILDTADIVEVVSDFVHLKKRGSNYMGLCPFHNERTPSFSVSKTKGICKCFSCGKGGSPVNFLMELEQMSYAEALRYLARKYNIEIKEHEMSEQEREAVNNRESMLAVNDFALHFFEDYMTGTDKGRAIGMAYFRERGINDAMIKRFHLGLSPEGRSDLRDKAVSKGYDEKYLLDTGLCYRTDRGTVQDRFRGRVMYPVFTVSGRVIAFGGRTLRKDKDVAKYVNSPESSIYHKSSELYGLYQAKQAIVKADKCILVEGYMDVISMHQSGVENVVASSGTSLTEGQIRLIHRFTENVTVIYDSDAAGIKASLRGIDMLLAEGMNIKVLSLPDGEDPDSFSQSHSSSEVTDYISRHETDFIAFKTRILLEGTSGDPIERSRVIQSVVRSISVIPDEITRTVYIGECSRTLGIDEKVLSLQVAKYAAENREREAANRQREINRRNAGLPPEGAEDQRLDDERKAEESAKSAGDTATVAGRSSADDPRARYLEPYEHELMRYVVRYGKVYLCDQVAPDGSQQPLDVLNYVRQELAADRLTFVNDIYRRMMERVGDVEAAEWAGALKQFEMELERYRKERRRSGEEEIRANATDIGSINALETKLSETIEAECEVKTDDFCESFFGRRLVSSPDDEMRRIATDMVSNRHKLSKIHTKYSRIDSERDKLPDLVPRAVYNLKEALIECELRRNIVDIGAAYASGDTGRVAELMKRSNELNDLKKELSKYLGERVLSPRRR